LRYLSRNFRMTIMEPHTWNIEWKDAMSVGIPEVDEDHQRFVFLINELNRAIVDRIDTREIKERLQLIFDDAVRHFALEERLFRQWKYPDAEEHANKHTEVLAALRMIMESSVSYDLPSEWISVSLEVKERLINHLLTEDMKYAEYFHARKAQGGPS